MNKEKLKLMLEMAQSNPGLQIEQLIKLISIEDEPAKQEDVVQIEVSKNKRVSDTTRKRWTSGDLNTLIYMYNHEFETEKIMDRLGRTRQSIQTKASELRKDGKIKVALNVEKKPYEKFEKDLIRELLAKYNLVPKNVPKSEIQELAVLLNRTYKAIEVQLYDVLKELK